MILGNLVKISDMVIRKGVSLIDALKIFIFFMPYLLGFTIPLSLLLGTLLSIGRLISDNEIVAINVAGISLWRILKIFLILGVIFSLFLFILHDKFLPNFHYRYRSEMKNLYSANIAQALEPGMFLENFKNFILYVGDVKANKLKNIFIYQINQDRLTQVTFAKRGEFIIDQNKLKMKLEEGFRDQTNPKNQKELYRLNFEVFFMDLPIEERKNITLDKKPSDMSLKELKEKINYFRRLGISPKEFTQELHKRINFSFSPLTFIILGFGIASLVRHRERSINFGVACLCAGCYYLLLILGEVLVDTSTLPPSLGMWLPNILILSLGLYLLFRKRCIF
jgi:LPS export ABC transporter permease LptF